MGKVFCLSSILFIPLIFTVANAARLHPESYYQDLWCNDNNGETNVTMPIGTRADCVTSTHAIEFDFGDKWAEAIGQSLHYAQQTNKHAAIVLILEELEDFRFWDRLRVTIQNTQLPIDVWFVGDGVGELTSYNQETETHPIATLNFNQTWDVHVPYIQDNTGLVGNIWATFKVTIDGNTFNTELSEFGAVE
jgi:hypothetical protein